jgi:hypothetical protein
MLPRPWADEAMQQPAMIRLHVSPSIDARRETGFCTVIQHRRDGLADDGIGVAP